MSVLTMMEAAKRNSIIHRLNPFTKGLFCICMIAAPIVTINPFVSIPILIILWLLALPAGLKDVFYPTMCKMYPVMLSFIIIIWPFFYPKGEIVLIDWAFIHITLDGIFYAVAQGLRGDHGLLVFRDDDRNRGCVHSVGQGASTDRNRFYGSVYAHDIL